MQPLLILVVAPTVFATTMCAPVGPEPNRAPEGGAASGFRSRQADSPGPLSLKLAAPRDRLRLAEPLTLVATLVNRSGENQKVLEPLAPEFGALALRAQPSTDAEPTLYAPVIRRDARGHTPRSLAPGESVSDAFSVALGREGWLLGEAGRYRRWAE